MISTKITMVATLLCVSGRAHHSKNSCYVGAGALVVPVLSLLLALVQLASALPTPVWVPSLLAGGIDARSTTHLPCVSSLSGKKGICLLPNDCRRANGTRMGICMDHFYFRSCCRIDSAALQAPSPLPETPEGNRTDSENHSVHDREPITSPSIALSSKVGNLDLQQLSSLNMSDYKEVCGRRLIREPRIVGGKKASDGKWPWQMTLHHRDVLDWPPGHFEFICGGVLLNQNWAITAAHCLRGGEPSSLLLRAGKYDAPPYSVPRGNRYIERRVRTIIVHDQYDFEGSNPEYDVALLQFVKPITFRPDLLPICVPDDSTDFVGQTAHISGWGLLHPEDDRLPYALRDVSASIISNDECAAKCRATMRHHSCNMRDAVLCTTRVGSYLSGPCNGDSGGPLVIQRPSDKRWILVGIASWVMNGCGDSTDHVAIFARISEFKDWINSVISQV